MEVVADLHLHSKYSRAVSPQMTISQIARWAKIKGIDLLGTGDFTHSLWLSEIKANLEEEGGILKMRNGKGETGLESEKCETKFILTTEISSIYSQGGKCRKIHNIIIAPSILTVEKINNELKKRGCNLYSDGRPIVGLSAKNIAEIIFSVDKNCLVIPAHIWTPWFSLFGANSGFDSVEECFGEFSKYIYAVETGLSSDPEMNWRIIDLNNRSIVSFSDAHSGGKLGRECTVFDMGEIKMWGYREIRRAIVGEEGRIKYTIEFYPEEGKYHYSGHRKCAVVFSPQDSLKKGTTCPVCGKRLTPGVMERVEELRSAMGTASITEWFEEYDKWGVRWIKKEDRPPFIKLVPLGEIIAEVLELGESSKKVEELYFKLIEKFGSEIEILAQRDLGEMGDVADKRLKEGIAKVRRGDIFVDPGFDGEFGKVKVWGQNAGEKMDNMNKKEQMELF